MRARGTHNGVLPQELMEGGDLQALLKVVSTASGERAFGWYNRCGASWPVLLASNDECLGWRGRTAMLASPCIPRKEGLYV